MSLDVAIASADLGRRELKKRETRTRLVNAARALFSSNGFEPTAIEEIAEAAGVSRRTYFRYFPTKEAIAFPYREQRLARFAELIAAGPVGDTAWQAVRRACLVMAGDFTRDRDVVIAFERIVATHAALRAAGREHDRGWEQAIAQAMRAEADDGADGQRTARLVAGAMMGLVRAALDYWVEQDGEPNLVELAHEVFEILERGVSATYPHLKPAT